MFWPVRAITLVQPDVEHTYSQTPSVTCWLLDQDHHSEPALSSGGAAGLETSSSSKMTPTEKQVQRTLQMTHASAHMHEADRGGEEVGRTDGHHRQRGPDVLLAHREQELEGRHADGALEPVELGNRAVAPRTERGR